MSDTAKPEPHPFERFREALKQIVAVPREEILRREAEYKKQRKAAKQAKK